MSEAMFDLVSVARRGPGQRDKLSPSEIAQIARTTRRVPEAMVKVLPKGATTSRAVKKTPRLCGSAWGTRIGNR
jgi:hypothetical protein